MNGKKIIALVLIFALSASAVYPCTTFYFKDKKGNIIFGRNFDFPTGLGHIQINLRDQVKKSITWPGSNEVSLTWVSKYGSITFNQNGRELPYGGMNEAGLVIEQMMLPGTKYPPVDNRGGLTELQWIQYQLDMCATVEEVINTDKILRISPYSKAPIHFLVTDAGGNAAAIEYLDGKMTYYSGESFKFCALANDTYNSSSEYKMNKDSGENKGYLKERENSLERFYTASTMVKEFNPSIHKPVDYAFGILKNVSQKYGTRWSIVYDVAARKIFYRTDANERIRELSMNDFNFAGTSKWLYLDINQTENKLEDFKEFNAAANKKLILDVWNSVEFLKNNPPEDAAAIAEYPLTVKYKGNK